MDASSLHFFLQCGVPPWRELQKTTGIIGTPLLELHTRFLKTATYGERLQVYTRVEEWRSKVFVQHHRVMRADTLLCEGRETRAFVIHPNNDADHIKAIQVPESIRLLCS
jgi:4-hydroxybenzoyl-CoA thioesterase